MAISLCNVVGLIFTAGVFGGTVNYALARTAESRWNDAAWSVVIGLGAAFLVPLFLNTISSSLLTGLLNGTANSADPFVFFGFCLLGAIASKSMIQSLAQKVLRVAEETKREVAKLKEEVEPIIVKETEQDQVENEGGKLRVEAYGLVGEDPHKIIKALGNSKFSRRTVLGIEKESGIEHNKVLDTLKWLQQNGFGTTTGEPNHYWSLTEKGRNVFNKTESKGPDSH